MAVCRFCVSCQVNTSACSVAQSDVGLAHPRGCSFFIMSTDDAILALASAKATEKASRLNRRRQLKETPVATSHGLLVTDAMKKATELKPQKVKSVDKLALKQAMKKATELKPKQVKRVLKKGKPYLLWPAAVRFDSSEPGHSDSDTLEAAGMSDSDADSDESGFHCLSLFERWE